MLEFKVGDRVTPSARFWKERSQLRWEAQDNPPIGTITDPIGIRIKWDSFPKSWRDKISNENVWYHEFLTLAKPDATPEEINEALIKIKELVNNNE